MKVKPASRRKAMLIRTCVGTEHETVMIRIYNPDRSYKDYDLYHHDLEIIIDDDSACLYEDGDNNYIDYSPEALGTV